MLQQFSNSQDRHYINTENDWKKNELAYKVLMLQQYIVLWYATQIHINRLVIKQNNTANFPDNVAMKLTYALWTTGQT